MGAKRVGILGYEGIQALDLVGPAETLMSMGGDNYEIVVIGVDGMRFVAETGLRLHADVGYDTRLRFDTLIVPGGSSMRDDRLSSRVATFITARASRVRRVASVCTGVYGVARTGLLDGRRVTTHWRFAADLQQRYPRLRVEPDALYIKDGRFYTSAGITAGIDLTLALIEEDCGPQAALSAAREMVVYMKRPGGQNQFSEPLQFQVESADRFADLVAWIASHLRQDLSVEALASRVFLGVRQFTRAFREAYGMTPAAFVEVRRMEEAGRRLTEQRTRIDAVGRSVGYHSSDVFRRAFERHYGITPSDYQARFRLRSTTMRR